MTERENYQCALCGYITKAQSFVDAMNKHTKESPSCSGNVWHDLDNPTYSNVPAWAALSGEGECPHKAEAERWRRATRGMTPAAIDALLAEGEKA
jgi:hypothetical protein